jgi:hypothetical protein
MKKLLGLGLLLALQAQATITTNVVHMEEGVSNVENTEVFVTHEGRVFEVDPSRSDLVEKLEIAKTENLKVEIEVEEGAQFDVLGQIEKITAVSLLSEIAIENNIAEEIITPMTNYTPSNVESVEKANEIFKSLNGKTKRWSQCFNRAHVWSKQMYDKYGVNSMKILIYYTKKYRKEVSKKWWFHIAPMIDVNGEYYVMDREFTRAPITAKKWESIFNKKMKTTGYRCKQIDNISEYYNSNNTNNELCNIQYTSMFYWEPNDMSRLEKTGAQKTAWSNRVLKMAAKEGFKKHRKVYKEIKE